MVVSSKKKKTDRVSEVRGTSTMERMKKILGSPMARKKNIAPPPPTSQTPPSSSPASNHKSGPPYIGVPLAELVRRENRDVPLLVTKVCSYIHKHGMDQEGVFRVNGNSRIVERLRAAFDTAGDADLAEADDVMAVAGLLKLFLRELPNALIPDKLTQSCVQIQEDHIKDNRTCLVKLRALLTKLQRPNYATLKYLMRFLVLVTLHEDVNKMSPMALGIVFGPNLFRCSSGIQGLKEQGITNHITLKFIQNYNDIFLEEGEASPYSPGATLPSVEATMTATPKPSRMAPPRPPPPKVEGNSSPPVPSPRKHKNIRVNGTIPRGGHATSDPESWDADTASERHSNTETGSRSDEEYLDTNRSNSPFVLDSDRSEYGSLISPRNPPATGNNHVVEKVISSAITEILFGDSSSNHSSDDSLTPKNKSSSPVPAPRRKKRGLPQQKTDDSSEKENTEVLERRLSVKERINQLQNDKKPQNKPGMSEEDGRPRKQRPTSKAFEMFEEQGIVIGMAPPDLSSTLKARQQHQKSNNQSESDSDSSGSSREPVQNTHDTSPTPMPKPRGGRAGSVKQAPGRVENVSEPRKLPTRMLEDTEPTTNWQELPQPTNDSKLSAFKRAPGPKNRRNPSRPKRSNSIEVPTFASSDGAMNNEAYVDDDDAEPEKKHPKPTESSPPPPKPRPFLVADENKPDNTNNDVNHNETTKPSIRFLNQHPSHDKTEPGTGEGGSDPDHSPTVPRKPCVPPLDLSILHEHGDGSEPIPAEQGHSLSLQKAKQYKDEEAAVLSPRMMKLKQKKNAHPDTDVPPSPPTDQTHIQSKRLDDANSIAIKQLTKKIQSHKKRIKLFEEAFEQEHGYRPSKSDKVAQIDIKRSMQELDKARKELRKVKEDIEAERRAAASSPSGLAVLPNGRTTYGDTDGTHAATTAPDDSRPPTMEETLHLLQTKLEEKRTESHRPEELEEMTREETQEEKLAVQKALLHFENIHGRPTTKAEKELMRPLYDRYRNIKKILTKPPSPRDKMSELQAVPEDQTIEFTPSPSTAHTSNRDPIHVPTADQEDPTEDFLVTKDFRLLKDTIRPSSTTTQASNLDLSPDEAPHRNLHELTVPQLLEEQQRGKNDKKRLRKILRDFEEDFTRQTGRKVQKEDRTPMESEYQQYKQVKARLKLLDALLSKHDPLSAY